MCPPLGLYRRGEIVIAAHCTSEVPVHMYVLCMCTHVHMYIFTCVHTYIHIHVCMYMCVPHVCETLEVHVCHVCHVKVRINRLPL